MPDTIADDGNDDLNAKLEGASDLLTRLVVPLYQDDRGTPDLIGSAFFVFYRDAHFLVSAAHVFDKLKTGNIYYYVKPSVIRNLGGRVLLSKWEGTRKDDPVDIGVLKLEGGHEPPYPDVDKFAMDFSYLAATARSRVGRRYAVVGFPASRAKVNRVSRQVKAEPFSYLARSIEEADYSKTGHHPSTHLVMHFDRKRSFDLDGSHRMFPDPYGISGSPIFELYDDDAVGSDRVFPVVGLVTTQKQQQHRLVGTDPRLIRKQIQSAV